MEAPPKEYLTDFGDDDKPPKNAHLRRIDKGVIPGYDGIAILYHPDTTKKAQDCIDGTHVWIHNEKGFLTQVYLEEDGDKFKLVRGPRRPDIEAHNELNAQERRRCRREGGTFLPIPPDSDDDAEDNTQPPSPISHLHRPTTQLAHHGRGTHRGPYQYHHQKLPTHRHPTIRLVNTQAHHGNHHSNHHYRHHNYQT
jgi:hypothetical protein